MGYWGDNDPAEELRNWVQCVQRDHGLTNVEMLVVVARVIQYLGEMVEYKPKGKADD